MPLERKCITRVQIYLQPAPRNTPLLIIHFSFILLVPGYSLLPGSQTDPTSCHVPVLTPDQVSGGLLIPHVHTVKVTRGFLDLSRIFSCNLIDSEIFADMP